jgi:Na+-driven multidrug efflux pump
MEGATLASMYMNVFGISIGFGLSGGLDTLCSQANGAGDKQQVILIYFFILLLLLIIGRTMVSALLSYFVTSSCTGFNIKLVFKNNSRLYTTPTSYYIGLCTALL